MHYWLGSFCRVINDDKSFFPINVVAISDIIKLEQDLGNQIPNKCWMLYLLELFNIHNKPVELNLICQFDNQNYFEAIFLGINRYRFKDISPEIDHSYQRIIYLDEENTQIKYILTDQTTNKSEIFILDIKNINFVYKTSNQFTGIEWWNRVGHRPYSIRFEALVSKLMYGYNDNAEDPDSKVFFPIGTIYENKDGTANSYPINLNFMDRIDGCIRYIVK